MKLDVTNNDILDVSPFVDRYSNLIRVTETVAPPRIVTAIAPIAPIKTLTETVTPKTAVAPTLTETFGGGIRPTTTTITSTPTIETVGGIRPITTTTTTGIRPTPTPVTTIIPPRTVSVIPTTPTTPTTTAETPKTTTTTPMGGGAMSGGGGAMGGGGGAMSGGATEEGQEQEGQEQQEGQQGEVQAMRVSEEKSNKYFGLLGLLIGAAGGYFYAKQNNKNLVSFALIGSAIGVGIGLLIQNMKDKNELIQKSQPQQVPQQQQQQQVQQAPQQRK